VLDPHSGHAIYWRVAFISLSVVEGGIHSRNYSNYALVKFTVMYLSSSYNINSCCKWHFLLR